MGSDKWNKHFPFENLPISFDGKTWRKFQRDGKKRITLKNDFPSAHLKEFFSSTTVRIVFLNYVCGHILKLRIQLLSKTWEAFHKRTLNWGEKVWQKRTPHTLWVFVINSRIVFLKWTCAGTFCENDRRTTAHKTMYGHRPPKRWQI